MAAVAVTDSLLRVLVTPENVQGAHSIIRLIEAGFSIFFGASANELAGRRLLENGWVFTEPKAPATALARQRWGLPNFSG